MTKGVLFLLLITSFFSFSQEDQKSRKLLDDVLEVYKKDINLEMTLKYNLYEDFKSTSVFESYMSKVFKQEKKYFIKIHNTDMIYANNLFLRINHDEKAISISKEENDVGKQIDVAQIIKYFEPKNILEKETFFHLELWKRKGFYLPYSKIILVINKKSKRVKRQVLFFNTPIQLDDLESINYPRLEIVIIEEKPYPIVDISIFDTSKIVKKVGQTYILTKEYSEYELFDATKSKI